MRWRAGVETKPPLRRGEEEFRVWLEKLPANRVDRGRRGQERALHVLGCARGSHTEISVACAMRSNEERTEVPRLLAIKALPLPWLIASAASRRSRTPVHTNWDKNVFVCRAPLLFASPCLAAVRAAHFGALIVLSIYAMGVWKKGTDNSADREAAAGDSSSRAGDRVACPLLLPSDGPVSAEPGGLAITKSNVRDGHLCFHFGNGVTGRVAKMFGSCCGEGRNNYGWRGNGVGMAARGESGSG
jgi:hypothetical protein